MFQSAKGNSMNKPKFINRPNYTTLKGTPRKKHRSLTLEEINYLKQDMHLRFSKAKDYTAIQWNFSLKFKWKPDIITIKNFYERKTYQWVWEDIDNIPVDKLETLKKQTQVYDEYKNVIVEALKDPYFGGSEQNFYEYLEVFAPKIKITKSLFFYLRKKFNITPQSKQRTDEIINTIVSNKELETPLLYELLNKEFDLNFVKFNYYCRKANVKKAITENGYKRYCQKQKEKTLTMKFELRYQLEGKFYIDEITLPKALVNKFKKKILNGELKNEIQS